MKDIESVSIDNAGYVILELTSNEDGFEFEQSISAALSSAESELQGIEEKITETTKSIKALTPECDKTDYILSVSSGALCGFMDVFLVGKPGESPIGDLTDKWFENRTRDFARRCGWNDTGEGKLSSAIRYLENKFRVPYDQSMGNAATDVFNIKPKNHRFKSLSHNPSLLGLFFSILDQFNNTSHFVSEGELITLYYTGESFELQGHNIPSKLFCAFCNWFGHLISDMSGSSTRKGRGMGIPSPLWIWMNDIIAIKRELLIPASEFDKNFNKLAMEIYRKGYDARFQTAQIIPVFINEIIVRMFYSVRRAIQFFSNTEKESRTFSSMWKACEPFSNVTVKRMLTVAHGTFCLVDIGFATIQGFKAGGGSFNVKEFVMRLNIIGVGRFTISLYGEAKRGIKRSDTAVNLYFLKREKTILDSYIEGLQYLSVLYNDQLLLSFTEDLRSSDLYVQAFEKSVQLAEKRKVPDEMILKTKSDIDHYFRRGTDHV